MLHIRPLLQAMLLSGALAAASPIEAHEFKAGTLLIGHPWTRATPAGARTAGGYLKITNNGAEADRLIGGSAEGADAVEVHEMAMENNIMRMRRLENGVEIKPGQTVELKPGSYHLMMIGLKEPFKKDAMLKGTLQFQKAGSVPVAFNVEAMGAAGSTDGNSQHKGH
jgi:periplasmic copper chaperone A